MKSHAPALRQSPPVPDDGLSRWCLEKACLTTALVTRRLAGGGKLAQAVEGYPFSWGAIAERQEPGLLVWEFYLEEALGRFESAGRRLDELQALLFESLEARLDCVSRSFVVGCARPSRAGRDSVGAGAGRHRQRHPPVPGVQVWGQPGLPPMAVRGVHSAHFA